MQWSASWERSVADTILPEMMGKSGRRHQMTLQLHSQRCDAVKCWRTGLAQARDAYRQWAGGPRNSEPPNVVGDEWFEGLRPHLPMTGDAAMYRTAHEVHCDNQTLTRLSLEIGRIEREWTEEAQSHPRRKRGG